MTLHPFYLYSNSQSLASGDDLDVIRDIYGTFGMSDFIHKIPYGSIVIPRFRAIPFGRELEKEVEYRESVLINSFREHRNIADIFNWVPELGSLTAPAYRLDEITSLPESAYFVKGETNSRKNDWFNSAYAPSKDHLSRIVQNLQKDSYIQSQEIAIRPFQDFKQIGVQVDGRPFFNERRVFVLDGEILSEAFYWSSYLADGNPEPPVNDNYMDTLTAAINRTEHLARFYVIDMAEMSNGEWQVVELNDGAMSGLSENSTEKVFGALYNKLRTS